MTASTAGCPDLRPLENRAVPRDLSMENEFEMVTAGIDVGSATSHLLFARILMRKVGTRYVAARRTLLHESPVLLTPYLADEAIDGRALAEFVQRQYAVAGLRMCDITAGVVILTGVALSRRNAREIAERLAIDGGRFLAVSAGDDLEAVLSAYGGGAVRLSEQRRCRVLHIDIGGGTTKLTVCEHGRVVTTAALDAGARLVVTDDAGHVARLEPAARRIARILGLAVSPGERLPAEDAARMVRFMVDEVVAACGLDGGGRGIDGLLLRTPPLRPHGPVELITVAGGVAEYVHGRQHRSFGDLGSLLADELGSRLRALRIPVAPMTPGIRATVVGASQYACQVSGSTIFISDPSLMPVRNVPVVLPEFDLGAGLSGARIAADLVREVHRFGLGDRSGAVAVGVRWDGSPSYPRIDAVARGLVEGYEAVSGADDRPLVVVCDEDVAAALGRHIVEELHVRRPVVAVDGIELRPFDFIDIGEPVPGAAAVPVVIKSLLFPDQ